MSTAAAPPPADPCAFVIFGASGDLTHRLLVPALYNLEATGLLPAGFTIIGVARREMSVDEFRRNLVDGLRKFATRPFDEALVDRLLHGLDYLAGEFDDPATYRRLHDAVQRAEYELGTRGNAIFYLATPPSAFAVVARGLAEAGLLRQEGGRWRRVIVEKPFGTDLASARELNRTLRSLMDESQIYRIDHYLGKETVQNIMVLRFGNGLFEPLWNRDHVDHVQITVAETVGVESRGRFYDATGALRDMVPNHVFQLLALTAMEPPVRFDAEAVRTEKTKLLCAIQAFGPEDAGRNVVRAQYEAGTVKDKKVAAYRRSPDVAPDSTTETLIAMKLKIDNWRWGGVPFYLRTGKSLAARRTEVAVKFKQPPFAMFRDTPVDRLTQNFLVLRIQPDEGVALQFNAKVPGPVLHLDGVRMDFKYKDYFAAAPTTGYETLIYDCMKGDATLFQRDDTVEEGWRIVEPLLQAWQKAPREPIPTYEAGSEGPAAAQELMARDGRQWRRIGG
jgi:glucose-6-phosphate 1-dehydrogenase